MCFICLKSVSTPSHGDIWRLHLSTSYLSLHSISSCFLSPSSLSLFPISLTTRKIPVHENPLEHLCAGGPPSLLSPGHAPCMQAAFGPRATAVVLAVPFCHCGYLMSPPLYSARPPSFSHLISVGSVGCCACILLHSTGTCCITFTQL